MDAQEAAPDTSPATWVGYEPAGEDESLRVAIVAFSKAASARATFERWIGGSAAVATSIVTLSIFASLSASPSELVKLLAGLVSAASVALISLDKFSGKSPSTLLLKRAGEFTRLRNDLLFDGDAAFRRVSDMHSELIGTEPTANEKYWKAAWKQVRQES